MKRKKIKIWYDEEGDYLEINLKKCKDSYFKEVKKNYMKIINKETGEIAGYAIFNFTKRKERFIDLELPIPKEVLA